MGTVLVDGQPVEIDDRQRLNCIELAARVGVSIPRYCWHPGLSVVASCRMCLVETGQVDQETGEISMLNKLVPGCQTPVRDGMALVTSSEKISHARAMVEEDLLLRHPIDCPICDKAGECLLQDYHFLHGRERRRADIRPFTSRRRDVGPTVTLFVDRCVMCTRCVRFCREITESSELMVVNRGSHEEIDAFPGFPLDNKLSGNVVDLCPVGALGDRDFLYEQRVWFMERRPHVCPGCSTGCSIRIDQNQDQVYRLKPRENPHINKWWMCDAGRYGWKHVHDSERLRNVRHRTSDDQWNVKPLDSALAQIDSALRGCQRPAVVLSPFLTVEEAYLFSRYFLQLSRDALLLLGQVPEVGQDESFAGGFTIRAEKCPNHRGVAQVISGLVDRVTTWEQLLADQLPEDRPDAVWIAGGYPERWHDASAVGSLADVDLLIVQDLFATPLAENADWQLPAASFAERSGSYVNSEGRLQAFDWAVRPPQGVTVEGQMLWQLLEREGLYDPHRVRAELADSNGLFAAARGDIPEYGVDLKVNQLVS